MKRGEMGQRCQPGPMRIRIKPRTKKKEDEKTHLQTFRGRKIELEAHRGTPVPTRERTEAKKKKPENTGTP